ncbi:MAG: hypothetical protein IKW01_06555 [Firmicutes bacterium]|nr:hypothetical protein [Bacillota bacterium]
MKKRPELRRLLSELEERLKKCNEELFVCPEGELHRYISNGKPMFFMAVTDQDGTMMRKSLYRKEDMVRAFARKAYLKEVSRHT